MPVQLLNNQKVVVDKCIEKNMLNLSDCGTGKTVSGLSIMDHHFKNGVGPALVVCPKNLMVEAWQSDQEEYFPHLDLKIIHGPQAKRRKLLYEDGQIFVTTPGTFKNDFPLFQDRGFDQLYVDESAIMKNVQSQITKSILTLAGFKFRAKDGVKFDGGRAIPHRYPLTATAAPNSPSEYWAQVKLCTGPGNEIFNDNFYTFQARYFNEIDVTPREVKQSPYYNEKRDKRVKYVFRRDMFQEFCEKLASVSHVCRKQDMTDVALPEQRHQIHRLPMGKDERAAYDEMAAELVLNINNQTIKATNVLSEMMKLRQITSGFVYGPEKEIYRLGETKLEYLKKFMGLKADQQRLIFINFKAEAEQMRQLPNCEVIDGASKRNSEILAAFRKGDIQNLAANQQSLSHGVTVVNCWNTIYYSMNHSYEYMKQSRDRTHRIGQDHDCYYDYLHCDNSMDGVIHKATIRKEAMVNAFLATLVDIQNGITPDYANCDQVFNQSYNDIVKQMTMAHLMEK